MSYSIKDLERWAFQDELTGLTNRRRLALAVQARTDAGQECWFVAVDLDGFKAAQDRPTHGHGWGDGVLKRFALVLRASVRGKDFVAARSGGDEFVVLTDSTTAAQKIAGRIRAWHFCGVSASVGVGTSQEHADRVLYREKLLRRRPAA